MKTEMPSLKKVMTTAIASVFAVSTISMPANALTKDEVLSLNYLQVKGTGLANRCSEVKGAPGASIAVSGKKKLVALCLEPTSWQVEEEVSDKKGAVKKELVNTKLMTRQTYTLDDVSGSLEQKDGKLTFTEEDGIDYAATTVQLPGGERVPFLFSIKNLVAKGSTAGPIKEGFEFGGPVTVPSYRTGLFLDPKGRGTTTGYDFAGALPGLQNGNDGVGQEALFEENNKRFDVLKGDVEFAVSSVNAEDGEFAGVFVSDQPSDTDMGGKAPKRVLTKGIFYARVE
jgi:photosystem II oxygen-evolving enhancer protein 1